MGGLSGEQRMPVSLELARLLVGVYALTDGSMRRRTRSPEEHTTEYECPRINALFRAASGNSRHWTDADTWWLLRERWTRPDDDRPEILASRDLLFLSVDGAPLKTAVRQLAIERLQLPGAYKPTSIRMVQTRGRDGYKSEVLHRIIPVLLADIDSAVRHMADQPAARTAPSSEQAEAEQEESFAWELELARRLDVHSAPYPARLPPSALAAPLTVSDAQRRPAKRGRPDTPRVARAAGMRLSLKRVLKADRRVVVLGDPGGGKSTLLIGEVVRRAQRGRAALFVRLSDVAIHLTTTTPPSDLSSAVRALLTVAGNELGLPEHEHSGRLAQKLAEDPTALIALDGLDEVGSADLVRVRSLIQLITDSAGTVVVSSRQLGYATPLGTWREMHLDALPLKYAERFLEAWFADRSQEDRERVLASVQSPELAELVSTPVLLGIVATVAEEEDSVPENVGALYERYLGILFQRMWRPPHEWRVDGSEIHRRLAVASELAWFTATGGRERADGSQWRELLQLGEAIRADVSSDAGVAQLILQGDGIFAPYGRSRSLLHQRFIWVHRTVQEHLVGVYLANAARRNPKAWKSMVTRLVLGHYQWQLSLQRMVQLMDERRHEALMKHLTHLKEEGDPGYVISQRIGELVVAMPPESPIRKARAREAAAEGRWNEVYKLDVSLWRRDWLSNLNNADEILYDNELKAEFVRRPELVREFLSSMPKWIDGETHAWMLSILGREDPDTALILYVDALSGNLDEELNVDDWGYMPFVDTQVALLRRAQDLTPSRRLLLLICFQELGVDLWAFAVPTGEVQPQDLYVLDLLGGVGPEHDVTLELPPAAADALRAVGHGQYGDDWASYLGSDRDVQTFPIDHTMPVALLARTLRAEILHDAAADAGYDTQADIESLLELDYDSVHDAVRARLLLLAAIRCETNSGSVSMGTAVAIHRSARRLIEQDDPYLDPMSLAYDVLERIATAMTRVLDKMPFPPLLTMILDSSPEYWRFNTLNHQLCDLEDMLAPVPGGKGNDRVLLTTRAESIELICWAAASGMSVAGSLRGFLRDEGAASVVAELWERCPGALAVDDNAYWFATELAKDGMLIDWRDRFISANEGLLPAASASAAVRAERP